jgi:hypothetical protein
LELDQKEILRQAIDSLLDKSPLEKVVACASSAGFDGVKVPLRLALLHVRFSEDKPQVDALARFLWSQCVSYALSRRRREEFQKRLQENPGDISAAAEIIAKVKNIFITFKRQYPSRASEVGEVLAYSIAVNYLKASQMAAKMSLKTSPNMPVHGLDGIHAVFENDALTIYFLESKLARTANDGMADYVKSTAEFSKNEKQYLREYELVGDLGNLDYLTGDAREIALRHFDVINEPDLVRRERSVGVVCYSEVKHFSDKLDVDDEAPSIHEESFTKKYSVNIDDFRDNAISNLNKMGVDPKRCILFFVAVPDINELREKFYQEMGVDVYDERDGEPSLKKKSLKQKESKEVTK